MQPAKVNIVSGGDEYVETDEDKLRVAALVLDELYEMCRPETSPPINNYTLNYLLDKIITEANRLRTQTHPKTRTHLFAQRGVERHIHEHKRKVDTESRRNNHEAVNVIDNAKQLTSDGSVRTRRKSFDSSLTGNANHTIEYRRGHETEDENDVVLGRDTKIVNARDGRIQPRPRRYARTGSMDERVKARRVDNENFETEEIYEERSGGNGRTRISNCCEEIDPHLPTRIDENTVDDKRLNMLNRRQKIVHASMETNSYGRERSVLNKSENKNFHEYSNGDGKRRVEETLKEQNSSFDSDTDIQRVFGHSSSSTSPSLSKQVNESTNRRSTANLQTTSGERDHANSTTSITQGTFGLKDKKHASNLAYFMDDPLNPYSNMSFLPKRDLAPEHTPKLVRKETTAVSVRNPPSPPVKSPKRQRTKKNDNYIGQERNNTKFAVPKNSYSYTTPTPKVNQRPLRNARGNGEGKESKKSTKNTAKVTPASQHTSKLTRKSKEKLTISSPMHTTKKKCNTKNEHKK
eukprot:CFRG6676T1